MNTETDVLVLGGAGVDTIVYVPELPLPYADSYMVRPGIETRAGQTGDFVALGVSALGLRTHHLDMIGDDHAGDLVRALHRDRGIALTEVPLPGGTKRAVNLVGPDGRRLSLYDDSRSREEDRLPLRRRSGPWPRGAATPTSPSPTRAPSPSPSCGRAA